MISRSWDSIFSFAGSFVAGACDWESVGSGGSLDGDDVVFCPSAAAQRREFVWMRAPCCRILLEALNARLGARGVRCAGHSRESS